MTRAAGLTDRQLDLLIVALEDELTRVDRNASERAAAKGLYLQLELDEAVRERDRRGTQAPARPILHVKPKVN